MVGYYWHSFRSRNELCDSHEKLVDVLSSRCGSNIEFAVVVVAPSLAFLDGYLALEVAFICADDDRGPVVCLLVDLLYPRVEALERRALRDVEDDHNAVGAVGVYWDKAPEPLLTGSVPNVEPDLLIVEFDRNLCVRNADSRVRNLVKLGALKTGDDARFPHIRVPDEGDFVARGELR